MMTSIATATLVPNSPSVAPIELFQAEVGVIEPQHVRVCYQVRGDIDACKISAPATPRRTDRLWEHTCFEVFLRAEADMGYYEFNFSPSGAWAVYAFQNYRQGGPLEDEGLAPGIMVRRDADLFELSATIHLDRLPIRSPYALIYMGLAAVIEAKDGALSYWAHKHPGAKPDFHHPDSFALELAFPG